MTKQKSQYTRTISPSWAYWAYLDSVGLQGSSPKSTILLKFCPRRPSSFSLLFRVLAFIVGKMSTP